jgi:hypothetical protein
LLQITGNDHMTTIIIARENPKVKYISHPF